MSIFLYGFEVIIAFFRFNFNPSLWHAFPVQKFFRLTRTIEKRKCARHHTRWFQLILFPESLSTKFVNKWRFMVNWTNKIKYFICHHFFIFMKNQPELHTSRIFQPNVYLSSVNIFIVFLCWIFSNFSFNKISETLLLDIIS